MHGEHQDVLRVMQPQHMDAQQWTVCQVKGLPRYSSSETRHQLLMGRCWHLPEVHRRPLQRLARGNDLERLALDGGKGGP